MVIDMLYIEKKAITPYISSALINIKKTPEWKAIAANDTPAIRSKFDSLPKTAIRDALLNEQHFLCAYCMKRIRNNELHMSIEHWKPLSSDKEKALDYTNFLGVCKGGADLNIHGGRVLCCDGSKKDIVEMVINPLDQHMIEHIAYRKNGSIYFLEEDFDITLATQIKIDINETLCLNGKLDRNGQLIDTSTQLLKGRKDAVMQAERILSRLAKDKQLSSRRILIEIKKIESQPEFPEFVGTIIFFLYRKYHSLLSQHL